ncbi:MAG TPA: FIST N-terminal domain-containing protein [Ignavibacteria bacterium]|nr:FIST N-terminal domain-containing protein [Ignavibacteria bacterium]
MTSKTIKGNSPEEIKTAFQESMADGYKPTLAIIFISVKQDRKAVCEIFMQEGIDIFGATSSGEFIDGHQSEGAVVVMLLNIRKNDYCVLFEEIGERTLKEASIKLAKEAIQKFSKPALILCSTFFAVNGRMLDGESLVRSIEEITVSPMNICGGMAGDDITFSGTYVFTNGRSTDYGMIALALNEEKIDFRGMAVSGWKPIGVFKTITKCEDNLIMTIDGKPALEMYLRFLGMDFTSDDDPSKFFDSIGVHYPMQIERENREPMMCNPIGFNKEKNALICESNVMEGSKFRFSMPPDFDVIDTVVSKAKELRDRENSEADALLIFSCAGRLSALGPMAQEENEALQSVWKSPMAGFYTYGEFGMTEKGQQEFHSTTCCWVALKEKN